MGKSKHQGSDFNIVGRLIGFVYRNGDKIKYLKISLRDQEYWVKPSKDIRHGLDSQFNPGCWLQLSGEQQISRKTGILKLKADTVELAASTKVSSIEPLGNEKKGAKSKSKTAKILICQKSSCRKRGGNAVCQILKQELSERNLASQVQVKLTGCLKKCKKGPNLVILPDKTHYTQVSPKQISALLNQHF